MKLILALALGATAQFATPALRGGARRLEALELLGAEESAKVEAEQEAARATALAEAMAQLKEAQDMMAKAEALKAAAATAEAAPEAPKEPAAAEAPAEERVAVAKADDGDETTAFESRCALRRYDKPEGEKPQQTFMSTDEYSLATLPGSKSEYFPAILTAKCGIDKWTLALMR